MHEQRPDDPEVLSEIEKLGYDPRDVPISQTGKHAILLFVSVFAVMGVAWIIMEAIDYRTGTDIAGRKSVQEIPRPRMPEEPFPLIQTNRAAHEDIQDLRRDERIRIHTYGWIDKDAGVAYIPIDNAKRLILTEGLPQTTTDAAPASVTGEDPAAPGTAIEPDELRIGSRNTATTTAGTEN